MKQVRKILMTKRKNMRLKCVDSTLEKGLDKALAWLLPVLLFILMPSNVKAAGQVQGLVAPDSTTYVEGEVMVKTPLKAEINETDGDVTVVTAPNSPYGLDGKKIFNPSPERAVWMSALFPGLGQIYNRRYWKLPIIVGGFMGLGYATSWNNGQLQDYSQAYRDLMDNDPSTKSYMDFFPPNTREEDLDKAWLTNVMQSRRDFYRRNRDLCIICCVGLYLLCMVDAYVDASLAHFDISPDLSIDWAPAMMVTPASKKVSVGIQWAINF